MYLLRRILLSIPTLLLISMAVFGLGKCAPGDTVRELRPESSSSTESYNEALLEERYRRDAADFGLDKPAFYFSVTTAAFPDTFGRILLPERRERLSALVSQTGNWENVQKYDSALAAALKSLDNAGDSATNAQLRPLIYPLTSMKMLDDLRNTAREVQQIAPTYPAISNLANCIEKLGTEPKHSLNWVPAFHWNGLDNQYQHWLGGIFRGDWGTSFQTRTPVWEEIKSRLGITLLINGLAILFAYLFALPLGVFAARFSNKKWDILINRSLMALYAMPVFWVGGLLILFFATSGSGFAFVSGISIGNIEDAEMSSWEWFLKYGPRLVLPVFALFLHSFSYLALQMRSSVLSEMRQDYIRTARAKGLGENTVFNKHAFRNALFPAITIFGHLFPTVFAGSLLVEVLFNIQGMGMKAYDAFLFRDFPMLFAILMCSAVLTVVGSLLADFLYTLADPRVKFANR